MFHLVFAFGYLTIPFCLQSMAILKEGDHWQMWEFIKDTTQVQFNFKRALLYSVNSGSAKNCLPIHKNDITWRQTHQDANFVFLGSVRVFFLRLLKPEN